MGPGWLVLECALANPHVNQFQIAFAHAVDSIAASLGHLVTAVLGAGHLAVEKAITGIARYDPFRIGGSPTHRVILGPAAHQFVITHARTKTDRTAPGRIAAMTTRALIRSGSQHGFNVTLVGIGRGCNRWRRIKNIGTTISILVGVIAVAHPIFVAPRGHAVLVRPRARRRPPPTRQRGAPARASGAHPSLARRRGRRGRG